MAYYCSTTGCTNKAQTRGMCRRHYDETRDIERQVDLHMARWRAERTVGSRDQAQAEYDHGKHTVRTAYILAILGGLLGLHAFYLGKPIKGLIFLLTLGGFLIWWVVDLITLPSQVRTWNIEHAERIAARHGLDRADITI